jgi:hypothetical protein
VKEADPYLLLLDMYCRKCHTSIERELRVKNKSAAIMDRQFYPCIAFLEIHYSLMRASGRPRRGARLE